MSALEDRSSWLSHYHSCTQCQDATCLADLCVRGAVLASAVRASMALGGTWELR